MTIQKVSARLSSYYSVIKISQMISFLWFGNFEIAFKIGFSMETYFHEMV